MTTPVPRTLREISDPFILPASEYIGVVAVHWSDALESQLIAWRDAACLAERERCSQTARTVPTIIPREISRHRDEQIWVQGWLTGNADAARRIRALPPTGETP